MLLLRIVVGLASAFWATFVYGEAGTLVTEPIALPDWGGALAAVEPAPADAVG